MAKFENDHEERMNMNPYSNFFHVGNLSFEWMNSTDSTHSIGVGIADWVSNLQWTIPYTISTVCWYCFNVILLVPHIEMYDWEHGWIYLYFRVHWFGVSNGRLVLGSLNESILEAQVSTFPFLIFSKTAQWGFYSFKGILGMSVIYLVVCS